MEYIPQIQFTSQDQAGDGLSVRRYFTVEGAHVHEAYLVIAGEKLVGFYLPVESSFAPTTPVVLKTR